MEPERPLGFFRLLSPCFINFFGRCFRAAPQLTEGLEEVNNTEATDAKSIYIEKFYLYSWVVFTLAKACQAPVLKEEEIGLFRRGNAYRQEKNHNLLVS